MTLDLSFKELVDVAANRNAATGRPLLIAIDCIDEDPDQPRRNFSEQELEELSQSIREHGVLQPITVRRSGEDGRHVIVMGARRYRAAQRARLREIPALIQEGHEPDRYAQMIENIQRDDLRAPEIVRVHLRPFERRRYPSRRLAQARQAKGLGVALRVGSKHAGIPPDET